MSTVDDPNAPPVDANAPETKGDEGGEEARKLDLTVELKEVGPCKKHIKIVIPPSEIQRQFGDSLKTMRRDAVVPGFRPGRAPTVLVQKRFKKEVAGQVKSTLLMMALEQVEKDHKINAISRPDLDLDAIELDDTGPLTLELDVEVQPDFPLPDYKGLTVKRPVWSITEGDVDKAYKGFLERYAQQVPKPEGSAELGDYITADLQFEKDGVQLNQVKEAQFRLQPSLQFRDGVIPELGKALEGAKIGETRDVAAQIGTSSPDPAIRGQAIRVFITIQDLKSVRIPEDNDAFLGLLGFSSRDDLRQELRGVLERRRGFQQKQALRRDILDQLSKQVPFDLPADLVARQEQSTLRNMIRELEQAGLQEHEVKARRLELRSNAHEATLRNLKDLFILVRIAQAEEIKVEAADFDDEVAQIARRTGESERRVRSRIEKQGLEETLGTQVLENKTIERILTYTKIEDVPLRPEETAVESLEEASAVVAPPDEETTSEAGEPEPAASADTDA